MTFTLSGVLTLAEKNTGQTSIALTTVNVGDLVVVWVGVNVTGITATAMAGGGVTAWSLISSAAFNSTAGTSMNMFMGTVTTPGAGTATITYSSSIGSTTVSMWYQQFSSSFGSSTTWAKDVVGNASTSTTTTAISFSTLVPTSGTELYVGGTSLSGSATIGSTTGCVYTLDTAANVFVYDLATVASLTPTATQSPSGRYVETAALFSATGSVAATNSDFFMVF